MQGDLEGLHPALRVVRQIAGATDVGAATVNVNAILKLHIHRYPTEIIPERQASRGININHHLDTDPLGEVNTNSGRSRLSLIQIYRTSCT